MSLKLDVVGKRSEPVIKKYSWKDCALYALGIGATDKDLEFIYEGTTGGMKVYPSFGVIAIMEPVFNFFQEAAINLSGVLHAGHKISLHQEIASKGAFSTTTLCRSIYDKGKAALVNVEFESRNENDQLLFTNEMSLFCTGQGSFGGEPGPKPEKIVPPEGKEPVFTVSYSIPEWQAAIYRLSGDYNPLHIDPVAAKKAGFAKPILHGLCSYGYMCRAALEELCGKDVTKFKEFNVRFSSVVFPGDTLTVKGWSTADKNLFILVAETENGVVLDQSYVKIDA